MNYVNHDDSSDSRESKTLTAFCKSSNKWNYFIDFL